MRVFITGGTGLIGTAATAELIGHGHAVLSLTRSDASADRARRAGAEPLHGAMGDLDALRAGVAASDGVVHLAFDSATPDVLARSLEENTAALAAIGDALRGSDRPFVLVSGTPWIPGRPSTEADPLPLDGPVGARARAVNSTLALAGDGVRVSAVRLPRTVHDEGRGGFAGLLTDIARRRGVAGYPGDGDQRWPAVHARDAAVLFRLALETAPAGSSWHAVADEGDAVRDIAAVIGRRLGLEVAPVPDESFGPFGPIFAMDQPATSLVTRRELGWEPTHPSLLDDLETIEP